jgi:hypothetical protein
MEWRRAIAVFFACAATAGPCAAVTYTFSGFFGETLPPGQTDYTATFTLEVADFITADVTFPASALISCSGPVTPCASATFVIDAFAAGFYSDPGYEAIILASTGGWSIYYYFAEPAFATPGSYTSLVNPGTLLVTAVPEPSTVVLMLAGIPMLLGAGRLRRQRSCAFLRTA